MTQSADVVILTSRHSSQGCKFWWKVKGGTENDVLYATSKPSLELRRRAATQAAASKSKAVEVSETGDITEATWLDPLGSPFEAPGHLHKIRREELAILRRIKQGVDLVLHGGAKYIHKYMTFNSTSYSFETEVRNYQTTAGSPYLAKLHYVVTHMDVNRGLLIE